jgi:hypothetical protein
LIHVQYLRQTNSPFSCALLCICAQLFSSFRFGPFNDSPFFGHNNIITIYCLIVTLMILNALPKLTSDGKYVWNNFVIAQHLSYDHHHYGKMCQTMVLSQKKIICMLLNKDGESLEFWNFGDVKLTTSAPMAANYFSEEIQSDPAPITTCGWCDTSCIRLYFFWRIIGSNKSWSRLLHINTVWNFMALVIFLQ